MSYELKRPTEKYLEQYSVMGWLKRGWINRQLKRVEQDEITHLKLEIERLNNQLYKTAKEKLDALLQLQKEKLNHIATSERLISSLQTSALALELKDQRFGVSPCGHSMQYIYSEDGGNTLECLACIRDTVKKTRRKD